MPGPILKKSEYAAHRKFSPAYVSKLIKQGKLAAPALRADGKIDAEMADRMLAGEAIEAPPPSDPMLGGAPRPESRADADARRAREDADAKAMENARRRRELCDSGSVKDAGHSVGAALQSALLARRRDLAATLTAETDFNRVLSAIEDADRALLGEFVENVRRAIADLDAGAEDEAAA